MSSPQSYKIARADADFEQDVVSVVMPCCGFVFDAEHTDDKSDPPTYTCPACSERALLGKLEQAVRLLRRADVTLGCWHRAEADMDVSRSVQDEVRAALADLRPEEER